MVGVVANHRYTDTELITRFEMAGKLCGQLAIVLGSAALVGWAADIATQTDITPKWMAIQSANALCLVLVGTSLFAAGKSRSARHWQVVQLDEAATRQEHDPG